MATSRIKKYEIRLLRWLAHRNNYFISSKDTPPQTEKTRRRLQTLKHQCHKNIDWCWRLGGIDRSEAYRRLALKSGLPEADTHLASVHTIGEAEILLRYTKHLREEVLRDALIAQR